MLGWLNLFRKELIYVIHYTNRLKKENHTVKAANAGKAFDKIQHL